MITKNFVTAQTLRDIDDVNKRCKDLHVPAPPFVFVTTEVFNADGSPVLHQHEQARSWTRNFYNYVASNILPCAVREDDGSVGFGAGSTKVKATNGTTYTGAADAFFKWNTSAPTHYTFIGEGNGVTGIVVGTGTDAYSIEDYVLGAAIANGSSAGQLAWAAAVKSSLTYASETKKWTNLFYRDFSNNSGSAITVGESGLYWVLNYGGGNSTFLVERNVLASPVAVADGQILRVTYTTEMTFPA